MFTRSEDVDLEFACHRRVLYHRRNYTSITNPSIKPVDLDYTETIPPNGNKTQGALVLVHGMLGFKRNWSSLAKVFSRDLNCPVYAVDMRNHGDSPHAEPMDYFHMAADVLHFIKKLELSDISLLGHSISTFQSTQNLIVVDIPPIKGSVSRTTISYIEAMRRIEDLKLTGSSIRKEADELLIDVEKDPSTRAFLLSTLITPSSTSEFARFRVPLDILSKSIPDIGSFSYDPGEAVYKGRTLLVKGGKSRFVNDDNIPIFQRFFSNSKLEILDTGHWGKQNQDVFFMLRVLNEIFFL
ncbi:alpha/beta-hydrolase [Gymnopus androsaceus JB14]|uniref:Alpha/beta-hydrolase n=1 Tax=Gymnopus androsaceus JB14 TaxID=1447944 RepID=A0A6A4GVQ2_9AGAR|nr:alpha/beta-hydrolase [Gymnopus androsaceus JB14]